jgi:protein-S-isoprenylcysteine O-methyltransferase Ste14
MNSKDDHAHVVVNPFVIYVGLGLCAVLLQKIIPLPVLSHPSIPMIGVFIMIISFISGLPAVLNMIAAKTTANPHRPTTRLVLSGPYRVSRNPMYIGLTILYAGLMIYLRSVWGIILLPVVIWLITIWVVVPEEKYLERKFGAEYLSYKSTVRRWI